MHFQAIQSQATHSYNLMDYEMFLGLRGNTCFLECTCDMMLLTIYKSVRVYRSRQAA